MSEINEQDLVIRSDLEEVSIESQMRKAYLSYAMSVIVSRAIPDIRDGLKPVHRRILYGMYQIGCNFNKAHKKSARIVGDVMGKYHPHGDAAIYDSLVRMAQDFSMSVPLIDGQGNFGSIDADPPASMRYTEARFAKITHTMLSDIEQETVDFRPNYDGTESEPVVLPAAFPNLLVNGSEGIAVGMATSIPPHNLGEVIDAALAYIQNPEISILELTQIVPGPDFPTNGTILSKAIANQAMATGRGSIPVRGKTHIEQLKGEKEAIIITELPYQVVKSALIMKIAELVKDKRIEGISNIRDESNKEGMRVVVELKKDAVTDIVLNHLYKLTQLQTTFAVNMLALNRNKPELMNVKTVIANFIEFRQEIVTRRTVYQLNKARERAHILIGLHVAVDSIDKVIAIIRSSTDSAEAKARLLNERWDANAAISEMINLVSDRQNEIIDGKFKFTETQAKSILEMRLSKLTGIEKDAIRDEISELGTAIQDYLSILESKERLMSIISSELTLIRNEYAIPRRTEIIESEIGDFSIEDFIERKAVLISTTVNGYVKRTDLDHYSAQRRGGKGKSGMATLEDDYVSDIFVADTHSIILFFTDKGIVHKLKAYQIPETAPNARGRAFVNLLRIEQGEKIMTVMALPVDKEDWPNFDLIFATKNGNIRRSSISDFENINAGGKIAISLDDNDELIGVKLAKRDSNILLASHEGMATRFNIDELRVIKSRSSDGVRGMKLDGNDSVVSLCILDDNENNPEIKEQYLQLDVDLRTKIKKAEISDLELGMELAKFDKEKFMLSIDNVKELAKNEQMLLTITENGFGKRTSAYEYRISGRGGKGIININTGERNGSVICTCIAFDDQDVILISTKGKTIRVPANGISVIGRSTRGVKIFDLSDGEKVASVFVV